jgi:hypothetical protein
MNEHTHPLSSMLKIHHYSGFCATLVVLTLALQSCQEPQNPGQVSPADSLNSGISQSGTMNFEGEIISLPSPIQVANYLKKNNLPFKQELVHLPGSKTKYVNETKKALNMGVYGADLAYISNFNLGQQNADYVDLVAQLASELGVLEHVDRKIIGRLRTGLTSSDSLIKLNADLFHSADKYLKSNDKYDISAYILIGGWIESLHLAADAAQSNEFLRTRLGEQKYAATSIDRLNKKFTDPVYEPIRREVELLCSEFAKLESSYSYRKPIVDAETRTTYINSKTSVQVADEQLTAITSQITKIRNLITE